MNIITKTVATVNKILPVIIKSPLSNVDGLYADMRMLYLRFIILIKN
jgi:hypothetical protein